MKALRHKPLQRTQRETAAKKHAMAPTAVSELLRTALGGGAPSCKDPAALRLSLDEVTKAIAAAEAEVVAVVEGESQSVSRALSCAQELQSQLGTLQASVDKVPSAALQDRLEASVLRIPELRAKLTRARTSEALLHSLAEVHRVLALFEAAVAMPDLVAAVELSRRLGHARDDLERLRSGAEELQGAPLLELIAEETRRCEERLCAQARDAWALAALSPRATVHATADCPLHLQPSGSVDLDALGPTLQALGQAELCMADLGDAVMGRLLRPVLEDPSACVELDGTALRVVSGAGSPSTQKAGASLGLVQRAGQVCDSLETMLVAVHEFLRHGGEVAPGTLRLRFAAAFWSEIEAAVCEDCLLPCLASELASHSRQATTQRPDAGNRITEAGAAVAARVERMHSNLHERLHLAEVDAGMRPLIEAAARLQLRAVALRCDTALDEGRAILLDESAHNLTGLDIGPSPTPWVELALKAKPRATRPSAEDMDPGREQVEASLGEGGAGQGSTKEAAASLEGAHGGHDPAVAALHLTSLIFPRCRVSVRVHRLLALLRETLDYACACGPEGAALLYGRARDLVDLFVTTSTLRWQAADLTPSSVAHSSNAALVPHTALLVHNDALLLRHRCLTLGAEYARRLPPPLGWALEDGALEPPDDSARASFLDLTPELGRLAQGTLRRVVAAVRAQLTLAVAPGRGFVRVGEDPEAGSAAALVVRRLSFELRKVHRLWADTLPADLCAKLLGEALDAPFSELITQLLRLTHISEADSTALQQTLLVPIVNTAADLLTMGVKRAALSSGVAQDACIDEHAESGTRTPPSVAAEHDASMPNTSDDILEWEASLPQRACLRKAAQVSWVLGARLSHVSERHSAGELEKLSAGELLALLRALFEHAALQSDPAARHFVMALEQEQRLEQEGNARESTGPPGSIHETFQRKEQLEGEDDEEWDDW